MNTLLLLLLGLFALPAQSATVLALFGQSTNHPTPTAHLLQSDHDGFQIGITQRYPTPENPTRFVAFVLNDPQIGALWGLAFGAPMGQNLGLGAFIGVTSDITPVAAGPSLSLAGDGGGGTTNSGRFEVLDWHLDPVTNVPDVAAIDFVVRSAGMDMSGSLRHNSSIPLTPVPEPSAMTLIALIFVGFFRRRRR